MPEISTYDRRAGVNPDKPTRAGNQPPVADSDVNEAHDHARVVAEFLHRVLKRDSIDDKHMPLVSIVHEPKLASEPMANASWLFDTMHYDDNRNGDFRSPTAALDVVAHEMAHGIIGYTSDLMDTGQSGALEESFADVIGEGVQQWHANRTAFDTPEAARSQAWTMGEDVWLRGDGIRGYRSLREPRSIPLDLKISAVPQPDHMRDYFLTSRDAGGVHINSGIPNKAAFLVASELGTNKLVKIWYDAFTKLKPDANFTDAALATVQSASDLYGTGDVPNAVRGAWQAVGLLLEPNDPRLAGPSTYHLDLP